tara:strand:+ start:165 stop:7334 length:7170 start_codon:yes stop_codon:yes gene_type:complete
MPLSRLENFLVNTNGNILYVNPSDLDATDSFDNKGNSLTRPFVTIQRALIEAARFSYQSGFNNDRFDRTTILLYPGEHLVDNRPGLYIQRDPNNTAISRLLDIDGNSTSESLLLNNSSVFNLSDSNNVLRRFNSVHGGVIVPKGTSIVGLDLRKTKIRPLYVPNPDVLDSVIPRSAIFRVTGGCYFWQFSLFDANKSVYYSKNFTEKRNPRISHHKLTCFEYADGLNKESFTDLTDLQMYYFKLMNAYGSETGRNIPPFPARKDFEPNTPESKIVGDLASDNLLIEKLTSTGINATVVTKNKHNLTQDDQVLIVGVGNTFYDGSYSVSGVSSERQFTYTMNGDPAQDVITTTPTMKVEIEADSVTGASPYIFNCSLRSVFGMCGLHADGSKATGFKSMVVAQFTGIGLQKDDKAFVIYKPETGNYIDGITASSESDRNRFKTPLYINQNAVYRKRYENFHIKCTNDSFIQAVSVFAIGYANHFLSESGGEQSITNSNSNFGAKALVSKGFRKDAFARDDTGYVTHIVPPKDLQKESTNIIWRSLNVGLSTSNIGGGVGVGETSRLYIDGEKDITNPPTNVANGFKIGARKDDILYLNVTVDGQNVTYTAPILMQVPSGDGPTFEKRFIVSRNTTGNVITTGNNAKITLTSNHNFLTGESVVVLSDDGRTPDGIKIGKKYFVIVDGVNAIRLANTLNDALQGISKSIRIDNRLGGILSVVSRVTDKVPGDIGHPIQFDNNHNNWYILSSSTISTNKIHQGIVGFSTQIKANNSATYVQRISETRALDDRIYRLRYVIPKEFTETIAKKPEKNYTIQESKTVIEQKIDGNSNVITNRNSKIISGISSTGNVVTVTSELPHKLSVNDVVTIRNVFSSTNITGVGNSGYNGRFTVTETPSAKSFKFSNNNDIPGGTFTNTLALNRGGGTGSDILKLPTFERNEYDTTYTIQDVETIQDYITGQQDGIYYLTCLIGNISPTVSEFSDIKFKQNFSNLYPTIDKDNHNNDPIQAVSAASNELLGQVNVNDSLNSITKETVINYIRDNRIGFAVVDGISENAGFTTITSNVEHNLNSITTLSKTQSGSGYGNDTTLYDVPLLGTDIIGDGATAKVVTDSSGGIDTVEITHGGSAYGVGMTMSVSGGSNGVVRVDAIDNAVGKAIQVVGVGVTDNRNNSDYNGLFKVLKVPSSKSVSYYNIPQGQAIPVSAGIYTGPVGTTNGIFTLLDDSVKVTNIAGVANTTLAGIVTVTTQTSHGLSVGNKIKFIDFSGSATANYNEYDFVVKEKIDLTNFTIDTDSRVGTPVALAQCGRLLKYSLNSYGQDNSLASEKISGSLVPLLVGFTTSMSSGINTAPSQQTLSVESTVGISTGDFLQVDNEVMRVIQKQNANDLTVLRGVLGTQSVAHDNSSVVRKINPIPSELHRFSTIRASGHTFEYIGYGPGNYSTSLPQLIERTLEEEEELLAISKEEKGGVVFFSGMNDRGDFFSGDRAQPRELVLGESADSNSVTFDDVFIRNTLRVGGGANQNLPSEFNGPVNFTNKVTSTDSIDGIEAIKLLIKGNALNNPSFQVGEDASPSLIVNKESKNVGINTRNPNTNIQLDVTGTIRANVYENFKLSDLPDATEEPNYARNRIIKVKDDGSGYEMIDPHELDAFKLRSLNVSNDGTIYHGDGSIVSNKLKISGISTSRFFVGERVKLFGVTESSDSTIVPPPLLDNNVKISKIGNGSGATYYYWQAQFHLTNGKVGVSSQIDFSGSYAGSVAREGVTNTTIDNFNATNHNSLSLKRDAGNGILIYRQIFSGSGTAADANINEAKLVATLGKKELGSATIGITWKDFGVYEQTAWSAKGTVNEFLGSDSDTTLTNQIHFPVIARDTVGGRGWDIDQITEVGTDSITVSGNYNLNGTTGFGTASTVKVVHDNTKALSDAVNRITDAGGNFLDLPSGTYLTNKLIIPTQFTLRGNGKNSIIKKQYYGTDATDQGVSGGNALDFDGNLVGIGTTNATDVTISDITFDGNSSNNLLFDVVRENNLLSFGGVTSLLFKDVEIRNAGGGGLFARDSRRVSVENSTIVDGGQTDRYNEFRPLDVQNSETVRINDSLFENYPGAVDVSVTSVVATGGNIIRNCGAGIDAYATGKITTQNNVILGPSDEFIASPDIFDSDFDSINLSIKSGQTFNGPELLYIEDGEGFDLSSSNVSINAGVGTMVGLGSTDRTASLGTKFFFFDFLTQDSEGVSGRDNGFIQLTANSTKTTELVDYVGSSTALGYEIVATEFQTQPVGFSTFIGIQTGYWANQENFESFPVDSTGVGCTQYIVRLDNSGQISGITTGDVVKLAGHQTGPNIGNVEMTVQKRLGSDRVVFTFPSINATSHGSTVVDGDYITIRRIFTIAKGRVGVT